MTQAECLEEIHQLKIAQPDGWRARATRLVRRLGEIQGVIDGFGSAASDPRSSELPDPGPGDDPLAARIRAVMDRESKAKGPAVPLPGRSAWNGDSGCIEPTVDFDYDNVRIGSEPTEAERKIEQSEEKSAMLEALSRVLAFVQLGARNDAEIARRVRIVGHYVRPLGTQQELAERLGVTRQAVSASLDRLKRELGGKAKFFRQKVASAPLVE
jgi:hypothetical protein